MTAQRCIFCFDADDLEEIQPLYGGPTIAQPVAWVHTYCLADYATTRPGENLTTSMRTSKQPSQSWARRYPICASSAWRVCNQKQEEHRANDNRR